MTDSDACACFGELLEEARVTALSHAQIIIESAARLGTRDEKPHRFVMLGGTLALADLIVADHFEGSEFQALAADLDRIRKTLDNLRRMEGAPYNATREN